MPVTVEIKEENGKTGRKTLPAEIWERGGTWTFAYNSSSKVDYVIIDPDHVLPDMDPENNAYSGVSIPREVNAATVIQNYLNAIGGEAKLKEVKDLVISSEGAIQGTVIDRVNKYGGPDVFSQDITVPIYNNGSAYHVLIIGDSINIKQRNQDIQVGNDIAGAVKARYKLFPELDFNKTGYTMQLTPNMQIVNGQLAYLVTVKSPDGTKVKYFYDQKTGMKIKQYTDVPNSTVMEFGDYQDIQTGIKIPFSEKTSVLGFPIEFKVKSTAVNSGLTPGSFK